MAVVGWVGWLLVFHSTRALLQPVHAYRPHCAFSRLAATDRFVQTMFIVAVFFRTQEDDAFPYEESHEDQVPEIEDQSGTTWIRRENSGASGLRGVVLVSILTTANDTCMQQQ
jgi:hypothetical protein